MSNVSWIPFAGSADVDESTQTIHYKPRIINKENYENGDVVRFASNVEFDNGEIEFTVNLRDADGKCQIILGATPSSLEGLHVGINPGAAYGIAKYTSNGQWEFLDTKGTRSSIKVNTDYKIKVKVMGSQISLYINGILISTANEVIKKSQLQLVLQSKDEITFKEFGVTYASPRAFVVMQFTEEYNDLYSEVIRPVTERNGFECIRADEYYSSGPILEDILRSIRECSIIIADITPDNPNVYYEIGYAHGISKPTILLCDKKRPKLPFDISGFRALFYENSIAGKSNVERTLQKYLETINN